MGFWQVFLLVSLVAAFFVVWPTVFLPKKYKKDLRSNARTETNEAVYDDHHRELEQTMMRGEIDESELDVLKKDLEKTLVLENEMGTDTSDQPIISSFRSRLPVLALVFAIPVLSLFIYSYLGAKDDWEIYQLAVSRVQAPQEQVPELTVDLMTSLQARVKEKPKNAQNWYLLGSTAVEAQAFEEAVRAFRQVLALEPAAVNVKAELAQALFLRAGNTITPEVRQYTQEVLAVAPNLPTALGLAGIDAYRSGRYSEAVGFWKSALTQLDPRSDAAQALTGGIARAQVAMAETENTASTSNAGPKLVVKVSLNPKVTIDAPPETAVFVFARPWQGPRKPLAVTKLSLGDLPATVTLNNSMAMVQGMNLSAFPEVEVLARVSLSGSPIAQTGDWQANKGPVIVASQSSPVKLVIGEQIPAK